MFKNLSVNLTISLLAIFSLIFALYPELDIKISSLFFNHSDNFFLKNNFFSQLFFISVPILTKLFAFFCLIYLFFIFYKTRSLKLLISSSVFFLLIAAIIGPGLVVHTLFKDNFGRARPSQIVEFDGNKKFTLPYKISDQCNSNCSFPSGHASMAYYFTIFAYVARQIYFSRIYLAGLVFGSCTGLSRIMMGGHFASDIIASCLIVLVLNHLLYILWLRLKLTSTKSQ